MRQINRSQQIGLNHGFMQIERKFFKRTQFHNSRVVDQNINRAFLLQNFFTNFEDLAAKFKKNDLVVDIGSNDGTLLKPFKKKGARVVGVEPTNAAKDANKNGIRDDVELVIFKEYPNSAKTRAVLLQYALTLQLQMTLPITNKDTVTATVEDNESRADICLWNLSSRKDMKKFSADIDKYENFIKKLQLNTETRKNYLGNLFEGNLSSYSSSNDGCDLDLKTLPN